MNIIPPGPERSRPTRLGAQAVQQARKASQDLRGRRDPRAKYLPALQGRVFLEDIGHFKQQAETPINTTRQLPQFLPRVDWPNPPYDVRERGSIQKYKGTNTRIPPALDAQKTASIHRAQVDYPTAAPAPYLKPLGPFRTGDYRGVSWHEHITHCHNLLFHQMPRKKLMSNVHLQALLTIASYGLDDTYIVETEFILNGPGNGWLVQTEVVPEFGSKELPMGTVLSETNFMTEPAARQHVRDGITNRRFVVAPIHADGNHWCMSIFDRDFAELYILDTSPKGREARIDGICHLWARFWNRIGTPWHFRYFVHETVQQPEGWECGYLGAAWVMQFCRNRVGKIIMPDYHRVHHPNVVRKDIIIGNRDPAFVGGPSEFITDWPLEGFKDSQGLAGVKLMLSAVLCNELGISNHRSMRAKPGIQGLTKLGDEFGAYDRIRSIGTELRSSWDPTDPINTSGIQPPNFWSTVGGPQFSYATATATIAPPAPIVLPGPPPPGPIPPAPPRTEYRQYPIDQSSRYQLQYINFVWARGIVSATTWTGVEGYRATYPMLSSARARYYRTQRHLRRLAQLAALPPPAALPALAAPPAPAAQQQQGGTQNQQQGGTQQQQQNPPAGRNRRGGGVTKRKRIAADSSDEGADERQQPSKKIQGSARNIRQKGNRSGRGLCWGRGPRAK